MSPDELKNSIQRCDSGQAYLFPISPREVAESIGLDWWAAKKLHDDGWISFDPDTSSICDESSESEFRFVGSLVAAGCDPRMLHRLLAGLEKPYRYNISRSYYDWPARAWKSMPREQEAEVYVEELEDRGDIDGLTRLYELSREALERLGVDMESGGIESEHEEQ